VAEGRKTKGIGPGGPSAEPVDLCTLYPVLLSWFGPKPRVLKKTLGDHFWPRESSDFRINRSGVAVHDGLEKACPTWGNP
jgi:hypothetical protein